MSIFGSKKKAAITPDYTGLQIQTATNALPIPLVWGCTKIAPNVIWYDNFKTLPVKSSSGKGGSTKTLTGYDYTAAIIMALCEGPIAGIGQIWKGQSLYTLTSLGLTLFTGTSPQSPWAFATVGYPSQALGYQGTAYVCAPDYDLGDSATVSDHNFEVQGIFYGTGANGIDADPAQLVSDFLTSAQYGVGFPGASINATTLFGASGDASYQTYCTAVGLALSPGLTDQETASETLARWLQLTNSAAVWSGTQLKIIPYGDASVTGNGVTWNPNLTPVYSLTDDDYQRPNNEDPIQVMRSDPYTLPNYQAIEIYDRANAYNANPIAAHDQAAIEAFGLLIGSTITAHEICDAAVAAIAVNLILNRLLYVRNTYTWKLSWDYGLLEPMDLVDITDAGLGLSAATVRIVSIEEDEQGILTVVAEELPLGIATAPLYPTQSSAGTTINREVAAAAVNTPVIFEPPAALAGSTPQVWIAASGGNGTTADPNWGGAFVWISIDGATYEQIGAIGFPARQGVSTASLGAFAGTNPDTSDTLSVNLATSAGTLLSTSTTAAANGTTTLCLLDAELLSYTTATLTGPNTYALTGLYRGLYGTSPAAHASGAAFVRLDTAIFDYNVPIAYVGHPLSIKLQSFNVFGGGVEPLSSCTACAYTPTGAGSLGPILGPLSLGNAVSLGLITEGVFATENLGLISDPVSATVALGTVP